MTGHVICVGTVTVDLVLYIAEQAIEPIKYRASGSRFLPGGGGLIASMTVARLGGHATLAGAIGDDEFGRLVRDTLKAENVATDLLVRHQDVPTSRSAVLVTPDGERTIVNYRDDRLRDSKLPLAGVRFDVVLADTRWPEGAEQALRAAKDLGKPGVMDAEAPVRVAEAALQLASHVAFSEQGLEDFSGQSDPVGGLRIAAQELGAWVCVTRGPLPVICCEGTLTYEVPAFDIQAVDTLGAGDAWHGAFALGLARGLDERNAVRQANAVAAIKSTSTGVPDSLPDESRLQKFLKENNE